MSGKTYGYVRVSTKGQREDRQLAAMREFGVPAESIIIEKQSGKDFARPLYLRLVGMLRPSDVLVVKSIDRLGRNYEEILEQWARRRASPQPRNEASALAANASPCQSALRNWPKTGGLDVSPPFRPERSWASPALPSPAGQRSGQVTGSL